MKILFITGAYPPYPSGISDYCHLLAGELSRQGHEVGILTGKENTAPPPTGVSLFAEMPAWSWQNRRILHRVIRDSNPDVINLQHGGEIYGDCRMPDISTAWWGMVRSKIFLLTVHDRMTIRFKPFWTQSLSEKLTSVARGLGFIDPNYILSMKAAGAVLLSNSPDLEYYKESYPQHKNKFCRMPIPPTVEIAPANIPVADLRRELELPVEGILLAFHGFIQPGKGIETLLSALVPLWKEIPRLNLIFVGGEKQGSEYFENIKRQVTQTCPSERVFFSGYVPREKVGYFLRACDFAVLPLDNGVSFKRSSLSNLLAHELPVLGTVTEMPEPELLDGENILLTLAKRPDLMAEKIRELANSAELRRKLSNGAQKLSEYCSLSSVAKRLLEIIDELA